jgi:glycogen debranching enzyme
MSMKGFPSPEAEWLEADGLGNRDADWIAPKTWPRQAYSNGKFPRDLRFWILSSEETHADGDDAKTALEHFASLRRKEQARRKKFPSPLHRAGDAYIVKRGEGKTLIAGYPWFGDWGRDAFIALRGLCISTGRLDEAHDILIQWASAVSEGNASESLSRSRRNP